MMWLKEKKIKGAESSDFPCDLNHNGRGVQGIGHVKRSLVSRGESRCTSLLVNVPSLSRKEKKTRVGQNCAEPIFFKKKKASKMADMNCVVRVGCQTALDPCSNSCQQKIRSTTVCIKYNLRAETGALSIGRSIWWVLFGENPILILFLSSLPCHTVTICSASLILFSCTYSLALELFSGSWTKLSSLPLHSSSSLKLSSPANTRTHCCPNLYCFASHQNWRDHAKLCPPPPIFLAEAEQQQNFPRWLAWKGALHTSQNHISPVATLKF